MELTSGLFKAAENIYNSNKEILTQLPSNFNNKFLDPSKLKWLGLTMTLSYILSLSNSLSLSNISRNRA